MVELKFVNKSNNPDPEYKKSGDSGFDLRAWIKNDESIVLDSLERTLINTGIFVDIPDGYELQVRPRSGMALLYGLSVANTPGTVDSGYTGELCIIAINLSKEKIIINNGDRIAQAVLMPVCNSNLTSLVKVDEITKVTERKDSGFNSTGKK